MLPTAGIFLITLAAIVAGVYVYGQRRLAVKAARDTFTVAEVEEMRTASGERGGFDRIVRVKGTTDAPKPLKAPESETLCVGYRKTVVEVYQVERVERDALGRRHLTRERHSDEVVREEKFAELRLRDSTGTIPVDPAGAELEFVTVVDRFEPAQEKLASQPDGTDLVTMPLGVDLGSRQIGQRHTEEVIPLGRMVHVIGEATDSSGTLEIRKPKHRLSPFLISLKSNQHLWGSAPRTVTWTPVAMALGGLGMALVIVGM